MAKVTKERYSHKSGQFFESDLTVSTKGIFCIKFPPEVAAFQGTKSVEGKLRDEVFSSWKKGIAQYLDAATTEKKVILFKADVTARIYKFNGDGGSSWSEPAVKREDIAFAKGIAMTIQAGVFLEKKTATAERTRYEYIAQESMVPGSVLFHENLSWMRDGAEKQGILVLDWTEERERTVSIFCLDFETLVINVCAFSETKDVFQKLIDAKSSLFLPAPMDAD